MRRVDVLLRLEGVRDDYGDGRIRNEVGSALYDGGFSYGAKVMDCNYEVIVARWRIEWVVITFVLLGVFLGFVAGALAVAL